MARIVLATLGSSGDVNPCVALGIGLRERGHDVVFAIDPDYRAAVDAAGFPVAPSSSASPPLTSAAGLLFSGSPLSSVRAVVERYALADFETRLADLREAYRGGDLIVASLLQFAAPIVSRRLDVPWVSLILSPANIPAAGLPPLPLPLPGALRRPAARLLWRLAPLPLCRVADTLVNRARAAHGLPPARDVMVTGNLSRRLTALAISPAFVPPQPDWPPFVRETGFLFWDALAGWVEPPELSAFLDGRVPVVAISAGSMVSRVEGLFAEFFGACIGAVRRLGCRALVLAGPPGALPHPLPDDVLALPFAPFSRVYPRCAAAIHHGGIGTTAQALRAGLPSLVVPWGVDQFFHAGRIVALGAGLSLSRRRAGAEQIHRQLQLLVTNPRYRACARQVAARLATEDGVTTLCDALEAVLTDRSRPA